MHVASSPDRWPKDILGNKVFLADALDQLCLAADRQRDLHGGLLWYPGFDFRTDVIRPDQYDRTLVIAALIASDYKAQIAYAPETGLAILTDEDWHRFIKWFDDIPPWEIRDPNPLDHIVDALARNELVAIGRPKGPGGEFLIPPDFWERRQAEARLVLASCSIDRHRAYEPSIAFDCDVFLEKAGFTPFLASFAARLRKKQEATVQQVIAIFQRHRGLYEAGKILWHELIAKIMRENHLKNRDRIRTIGKSLSWKEPPGRRSRRSRG